MQGDSQARGQGFTPEHKTEDMGLVGQWKAECWLTWHPCGPHFRVRRAYLIVPGGGWLGEALASHRVLTGHLGLVATVFSRILCACVGTCIYVRMCTHTSVSLNVYFFVPLCV